METSGSMGDQAADADADATADQKARLERASVSPPGFLLEEFWRAASRDGANLG